MREAFVVFALIAMIVDYSTITAIVFSIAAISWRIE